MTKRTSFGQPAGPDPVESGRKGGSAPRTSKYERAILEGTGMQAYASYRAWITDLKGRERDLRHRELDVEQREHKLAQRERQLRYEADDHLEHLAEAKAELAALEERFEERRRALAELEQTIRTLADPQRLWEDISPSHSS